MTSTTALRVAAVLGFLAVALGAFGAHGLKSTLAANDTAATWETAVFYHFTHAIMLFVLTFRWPAGRGPWFCFLAGVAVFSGSLYVLAVTNLRWLGAITPLGGLSLLAGWAWLVVKGLTQRANDHDAGAF